MSGNGAPRPDNHAIVLFGATGELARRKLLPGPELTLGNAVMGDEDP